MKIRGAELLRGLTQIAGGKRLTERFPQVPCAGLVAHWDTFEKGILPKHIPASRKASAQRHQ